MIKSWNLFRRSKEDDVAAICKKYNIRDWTINSNGFVDVEGEGVYLVNKDLTKLPLQFGRVSGYFICNNNKLTTLEGCPKEVGGKFYCHNNNLRTLKGCPMVVDDFACTENKLTSLKGCPEIVRGSFFCERNHLSSLEGGPKEVGGYYYCEYNNLTSLEGLGIVTSKYINADGNSITNLTEIGLTMLENNISFPEAVSIHITKIPDKELLLVIDGVDPQKILDLNNFKIFNLLRTQFPKKYAEVMMLRDVSVESDLGELGF